MPPVNDPDANPAKPHTTYSGRFRVNESGETLLFLTPTVRSLRIWSWRDGIDTQHDYICDKPDGKNGCVGTGSQYLDIDPAAITPDGKHIVLFTIVGRYFRVRHYPVGDVKGATFTNIVVVSEGEKYNATACKHAPSWMRPHVKGTPRFSWPCLTAIRRTSGLTS